MRSRISPAQHCEHYHNRWVLQIEANGQSLYESTDGKIRIQSPLTAAWLADKLSLLIESNQFLTEPSSSMNWEQKGKDWHLQHLGYQYTIIQKDGRSEAGIFAVEMEKPRTLTEEVRVGWLELETHLQRIQPRSIPQAKWLMESLIRSFEAELESAVWQHAYLFLLPGTFSFMKGGHWSKFAWDFQEQISQKQNKTVRAFESLFHPLEAWSYVDLPKRANEFATSRDIAIVPFCSFGEFSFFVVLSRSKLTRDELASFHHPRFFEYDLTQPPETQRNGYLTWQYDTSDLAKRLFKKYPTGSLILFGWDGIERGPDEEYPEYDDETHYKTIVKKLTEIRDHTVIDDWATQSWIFMDGDEDFIQEFAATVDWVEGFCRPVRQLPTLMLNRDRFRFCILGNATHCDLNYSVLLTNDDLSSTLEPDTFFTL